MPRKKYKREFIHNNQKVTRTEFLNALNGACLSCDTHYDNPLLNVYYTDLKKVKRVYNQMMRNPRLTYLFVGGGGTFKITREEVK